MSEIAKTGFVFDIDDVIRRAVELPGAKVDRAVFLTKAFSGLVPDDVLANLVATSPAQAGVSRAIVAKVASATINKETLVVVSLAAAMGAPGAWAIALAPIDIAQYFAGVIRVCQKLAYIQGWPNFAEAEENIDEAATNALLLFMGVMFGAGGAAIGLRKLAEGVGQATEKRLLVSALTKGWMFPLVKKIATAMNKKLTVGAFAKVAGKAVPIIGAVVSGALTFASFRPGAVRLNKKLASLPQAKTVRAKKR